MEKVMLLIKIERLRRRMYAAKTQSARLRISQSLDKLINEYMAVI